MPLVSTDLIRSAAERMRAGPVLPRTSADRISQAMVDWAASHGLLRDAAQRERAQAIQVAQLAASTFTRHVEQVVQLGADLILWLYLFDDAIGEADPDLDLALHRKRLGGFERLLRSEASDASGPFAAALVSIRERATDLGGGRDWHRRFADDMADYFAGCFDEAVYRRAGVTPNVRVYRALRAQTVGTSAVFTIAELGEGRQPSREEMDSPRVVEVRRVAAQLTAWVNDIYSYPKEVALGDPMNLVAALARAHDLDPADAVTEAVAIYNTDLERLDSLVGAIQRRFASPALQRHLDDLVAWVHGNRAWTHQCGRYR